MINASELRIGNSVLSTFNSEDKQLIKLGESTFGLILKYGGNEFYPISLTPEILESCGFQLGERKVTYEIGFSRIFDKFGWLILKLMQHNKGFWIILQNTNLGSIQYLHQLQNLYFALTGEELNINMNVETIDGR